MNGGGSEFTFTDEEIREQLEALGFENVSDEQLQIFKIELERLVEQERDAAGTDLLVQQPNDDNVDTGAYLNAADDFHVKEIEDAPAIAAESVSVRRQGHVLVETFQPEYGAYPSRSHSSASTSDDELNELGNVRHMSLTPAGFASSGRSSVSEMASSASCYERSNSCSKKETSSESSSSAGTHVRKRKVLRKLKHGTSMVCEEAVSQSSESSSCIRELRRPTKSAYYPAVERDPAKSSLSMPSSSEGPGSSATSGQAAKKWRSTSDLGSNDRVVYKSKSVILPYGNQKQARSYFKMDPVALYHYYKKEWASHNIPGEKDHRQLRWNIRTMMSMKDDIGLSRTQSRSSFVSM